jgi:ABC-type dipeptide/oligopeptide/nickel transport system ATPase component
MKVGPGESPIEHWRVLRIDHLVERVLSSSHGKDELPQIVAIDGRSGGGKSTMATQLQRHITKSTIVHTDDVAWHHSYFGWSDLLIEGVLRPVRANRKTDYRPTAWEDRGRQGSIVVREDCEVVIIEGVGASRLEVLPWLTASIWIQSDMDEAERRGIARDGGTEEARRFWMDWMREENVFLEAQRPWLRAIAIVNGTPSMAYDPEHEVVVAA